MERRKAETRKYKGWKEDRMKETAEIENIATKGRGNGVKELKQREEYRLSI